MIDAKISFLSQLRQELSGTLTIDQMGKLMSVTNCVLDHFDMVELKDYDIHKDDLLECYVDAMNVSCLSPNTIRRYVHEIKKLMEFAKVPTRHITVYHLRSYLTREKERGLCDKSLEGARQVLHAYFTWLQRESLIDKNPTVNLGVIKVAKKQKKILSETDIEKLSRNCVNIRDKAILHFLLSSGCRISEMTSLNRESVNIESLECVVHGKGDKERKVYLSSVAGMLLAEYLDSRTDDNPALFVGRFGSRLEPGGVRVMLNTLAKKAGVEHVHPHRFRRTLATELSRHGMPIQEVARVLGHEKLDTTMKYVNLNDDDTKALQEVCMKITNSDLVMAIQCCMLETMCDECPLQEKICDDLYSEMMDIPVKLIELIVEALERISD